MNEPPSSSPWPAIVKIALLIGCTTGFCILGLVSGVLAAKVVQHAGDVHGEELLMTVLIPPVVGALFGFFVGMVSTLFIRRRPRHQASVGPLGSGAQALASAPRGQEPPRV